MREDVRVSPLDAALLFARHVAVNGRSERTRERLSLILAAYDANVREVARLQPMEPELEAANVLIREHILNGVSVWRRQDREQFTLSLAVDEPIIVAARIPVAREIGMKVAQHVAQALTRHVPSYAHVAGPGLAGVSLPGDTPK